MTINDFESKLQREVHRDLLIRVNPNCPDVAGVYLKEAYLFTVPSGNIYPKTNPQYCDKWGNPHRNMIEAEGLAQHFLKMMQTDKELYSLMAKDADDL